MEAARREPGERITSLEERMTRLEARIDETNKQIDRLYELLAAEKTKHREPQT